MASIRLLSPFSWLWKMLLSPFQATEDRPELTYARCQLDLSRAACALQFAERRWEEGIAGELSDDEMEARAADLQLARERHADARELARIAEAERAHRVGLHHNHQLDKASQSLVDESHLETSDRQAFIIRSMLEERATRSRHRESVRLRHGETSQPQKVVASEIELSNMSGE